jgi:L-amino acid N-acyltransferase YncA
MISRMVSHSLLHDDRQAGLLGLTSTLGGFLSRAASTLREQGPRAFAEKVAATLGLHRLLFLESDLTLASTPPQAKLPLEFRTLDATNVDLLMQSQPGFTKSFAERELAQGHVCVAALHEGQVVASVWVARDFLSSGWGKVRRRLATDEAYVYAVHTIPRLRGQGVNFALSCRLATWLCAAGVKRAYRLVLPWNQTARAAHRKAGFRERGQFVSLSFGRWGRSVFLALPSPSAPPRRA